MKAQEASPVKSYPALSLLLNIRFLILACATIGLAPFYPEPHIWGKLKWIAGGANGMSAVDWFDFLFHGWPWILVGVWIIQRGIHTFTKK